MRKVTDAHDASAGGGRDAVVVVNYGSSALLKRNLLPLTAPGGPAIVVVDNFSNEAERAAVRTLSAAHGWELVPAPNHGFAAGMNLGVEHAARLGCTGFLLLNPDVGIDPVTARALLDHVDRDPTALVTPAVVHPDGHPAFSEGSLDLASGLLRTRSPEPSHVQWLSGACLAVSRTLWAAVGGMDERYFMYWEDIDLSYRCAAAGGRLEVRRDLRAEHLVGGTQGTGKSPLYLYYNCRNRLLFAAAHLPGREMVSWLRSTPRYTWRLAQRNGRRALLRHPTRTVLPALRGSLAGTLLVLQSLTGRRRGQGVSRPS